jgi:hypothetical protein
MLHSVQLSQPHRISLTLNIVLYCNLTVRTPQAKVNLPWNRIISSFDLTEQLGRARVIERKLAIQHSEQHHT